MSINDVLSCGGLTKWRGGRLTLGSLCCRL